MLKTSDISNFLYPAIDMAKTANLCKNKKLFAWKNEGYFESWNIPIESFAMYLRYNPILKTTFLNYEHEVDFNWIGDDLVKKYEAIKHELEHAPSIANEEYTLIELIEIFGTHFSVWLCQNHSISKLQKRFPKLVKHVPVLKVIRYLHENADVRADLQDRHMIMLTNNDILEPKHCQFQIGWFT